MKTKKKKRKEKQGEIQRLSPFSLFLSQEINGEFSLQQSFFTRKSKSREKALGGQKVVEWRVSGREACRPEIVSLYGEERERDP